MCWPSEGVLEVEERRRKYKNGPRRKRLHFVKDRSSGHSDEWEPIRPRPHSRPELPEMQEQHHPQPHHQPHFHHPLQVEDPRWHDHLQQRPPMQQQIPVPPHHPQMGWYPPQGQLPYNQQHANDIIRVEEFHPEQDPHGNPQLPPVVIERQPRARMPSQLRARSRSRQRGHSRAGSSLFSDDSSYGGSHGRGRPRRAEGWHENDSWIEPRRRR